MPTNDNPHVYRNRDEVDIRVISYSDLYVMYELVVDDKQKVKGKKGSAVVSKKLSEIISELNRRTYGLDPYAVDMVRVHGVDPQSIDLNDYEKEEESQSEEERFAKLEEE